jgi:hypothetical protein
MKLQIYTGTLKQKEKTEVLDFPPSGEMSGFPYQCFFKFQVISQERFHILSHIFEVLKQEKQKILEAYEDTSDGGNDEALDRLVKEDTRKRNEIAENLFVLFDDRALGHFWWPTMQEREEHWKRWKATPIPQRFADPTLETPWGFSSMVDSLLTGEYGFLSCHLLAPDTGVLVFLPYSLPYGSSDAMKALIEAFDCEVIGAELGTGYILYE